MSITISKINNTILLEKFLDFCVQNKTEFYYLYECKSKLGIFDNEPDNENETEKTKTNKIDYEHIKTLLLYFIGLNKFQKNINLHKFIIQKYEIKKNFYSTNILIINNLYYYTISIDNIYCIETCDTYFFTSLISEYRENSLDMTIPVEIFNSLTVTVPNSNCLADK